MRTVTKVSIDTGNKEIVVQIRSRTKGLLGYTTVAEYYFPQDTYASTIISNIKDRCSYSINYPQLFEDILIVKERN